MRTRMPRSRRSGSRYSTTTRIEITFEAEGDATRMTVVQAGFPVPEIRDFFVDEVRNGALARITAYLDRQL